MSKSTAQIIAEHEKFRQGLLQKAENDTHLALGFRVKRINGEVYIVYAVEQVVVPGLGGDALLSAFEYGVKVRYNFNFLQEGRKP